MVLGHEGVGVVVEIGRFVEEMKLGDRVGWGYCHVYSAIRRAQVNAGDRVGVLGIGGLGHLAIQLAAKMGCNVVAFSSSSGKREEALLFGAHEFRDMKDAGTVSSAEKVNCLLLTAAKQPDWRMVLPWVERGGTISAMTVDADDMTMPYMTLVIEAIQTQGSLPAPSQMHREMLDFAALHGIRPQTELFTLDGNGIKMAMDRLRSGRIRYRAVLERYC
ncbi:hypothetical protein MY4038_008769 [Beauveria bassiana]